MMEIDITDFVANEDMREYSASARELGVDPTTAGRLCWQNAFTQAQYTPLLEESQLEDGREYLASLGAWARSELDESSDTTIQAMIIQFIAWNVREWSEHGVEGLIYAGDNGRTYAYVE